MPVDTTAPEAAVVVDPRIQARRDAVERDQRRHRRNRLLGLASIFVGLLALYGLTRSPLMAVNQVQVMGGEMTGVEGIKATAGIRAGSQMLDLDLGAARRRLEALPWVRSARIARSWPRTVRIVVTERHPVARIADEDGKRWWMADGTGRLLDALAKPPDRLVQVDGVVKGGRPGIQLAPRAAAALKLIPHFPSEVARRAVGLRFSGTDEVELVLQPTDGAGQATWTGGGAEPTGGTGQQAAQPQCQIDLPAPFALAQLGTVDAMDEKLVALDTVLTQVDGNQLATVDVRVPDKPVVTRRTSCR